MPGNRFTLIVSGALVCAGLQSSFAAPTLTLRDGFGNTANGTNAGGNLAFNGTVGGWTVGVTTTRTAGIGAANQAAISVSANTLFQPATSPGAGGNQLTITFVADGLPSVSGPAITVATVDGAQKLGTVNFSTLTNGTILTSAAATNNTGITGAVELSNSVPVAGFSGAMTIQTVIVANGQELASLGENLSISNLTTQTAPLLFLPTNFLAPNGFHLTLQGMTVGSNYLLQGSTDLVTWQSVTNFLSTNATMNLVDTNASKFTRRSYRAKAQ
jgi:hypothetical protein